MSRPSEFLSKYGPWAVIAGASKGIGEAFSRQLAAKGFHLVLIARGAEGLEALADELRRDHGVEVRAHALDLSDSEVLDKLRPSVSDIEVGLLIYNAAYSEIGGFFSTDVESKLKTIDVNCRGPILFVSEFGPKMVERQRGGLLLMSSISSFQGTAMVSTYAATKAFNTVLAEGMWEDLRHHGVDVLAFIAGATSTPNFNLQTPDDKKKSALPREPSVVAKNALASLGKGPTCFDGVLNSSIHFILSRFISRKQAVKFLSLNTRKIYE